MKSLAVVRDPELYATFADWPGVRGIPTSFVIQSGKVLWVGHPGAMKPVLNQVMAGRWTPDSEAQRETYLAQAQDFLRAWHDTRRPGPSLEATGHGLVARARDYPWIANNLAWALLTDISEDKRPLPLARKIAQAAYDGTSGEDYAITDTYARALYLTGNPRRALALQKRSRRLCKEQPGRDCAEIDSVLAVYRRGDSLP